MQSMLEAFSFGFIIAIAMGPIAIAIINSSISHGIMLGITCALSAALADFTFALISFNINDTLISKLQTNQKIIVTFSSVLLVIYGIFMILQNSKKTKNKNHTNIKSGFLKIYILTLSNPLTIILFLGLLNSLTLENSGNLQVWLFSSLIFLGSLIAQLIFAFFGLSVKVLAHSTIRINQDNELIYFSNLISGLAIIGFGCFKFF